MARVYNELIDVHLHGDATVKQYSGVGPLLVTLPDGRGDVKAASGDYVIYLGGAPVGVTIKAFLDPLREEDEPLDPEEEIPTGAILEATVVDNAGAPLANTSVFLGQDNSPIAEGKTDADGLVVFSVLPGSYQVRPKDKTKGPVQTVEATLETGEEAPPPAGGEGGVLSAKRRVGGKPKPDNSLPGDRFDVMGKPDPQGAYNSKGELVANQGAGPRK